MTLVTIYRKQFWVDELQTQFLEPRHWWWLHGGKVHKVDQTTVQHKSSNREMHRREC